MQSYRKGLNLQNKNIVLFRFIVDFIIYSGALIRLMGLGDGMSKKWKDWAKCGLRGNSGL